MTALCKGITRSAYQLPVVISVPVRLAGTQRAEIGDCASNVFVLHVPVDDS